MARIDILFAEAEQRLNAGRDAQDIVNQIEELLALAEPTNDLLEVLPSFVHEQTCKPGVSALRRACEALSIPYPRLRWFANVRRGAEIFGRAFPYKNEVCLRSDLSEEQVKQTAAHEAFHLAYPDEDEEAADRWADNFVARPLPRVPRDRFDWGS